MKQLLSRIKKTVLTVKNKIRCFSLRKSRIIIFSFLSVSLTFCFLSSSFSSNALTEDLASTIVERIVNKSSSFSANVSIVPKDKKTSKFNTYDYKRKLYENNDVFYAIEPFQNIIMYNSLKDKDVNTSAFKDFGKKLSFLTTWSFASHENTKGEHYLKGLYLRLMFEDSDTDYIKYGATNFCYIFKNQADAFLDNLGISSENRTTEIYKLYVINRCFSITCNSKTEKWLISNIIYDEGEIFKICSEWFGNCFLAYNHIFANDTTDLELVHSFGKDVYQDYYQLKQIFNSYPLNNYEYKMISNSEFFSLDIQTAVVNIQNNSLQPLFYLFTVFSILVYCCFLFFFIFSKLMFLDFLFLFLDFILAWGIFRIVKAITHSSLFFSYNSLVVFFVMLIAFLLFIFFKKMLIERG